MLLIQDGIERHTSPFLPERLRVADLKCRAKLKGFASQMIMPCKTDTRRSSATAPALLYLLHPCSRALGPGHPLGQFLASPCPCARGIPFPCKTDTRRSCASLRPRHTVHGPGHPLNRFAVSPCPEHKKGGTGNWYRQCYSFLRR